MQLYYSLTSPYARKVTILAQLLNLGDLELVRANPLADEALRKINPLGKVPALIDGDLSLFESSLICEYLDDKGSAVGGKSFLQRKTPQYYSVQKAHMLANGIMDAAVATVMELRRNDAEQSAFWLERWHAAMVHAVQSIDLDTLGDSDRVHIGTIATVCALGYLDFRLPPLNWRECNPALKQWYEVIENQPWAVETMPKDA